MLLRRFMAHVAAQNWFAVGLDFLIVLTGVFMGLQAQQWSERRADSAREQDYLERLSSDFGVVEEQLRQCLSVHAVSIEAVDVVSRTVRARKQENDAAFDRAAFADALVRMTASMVPAGRSATFVEMISSGDLGLLRDTELRNALIAYDQYAESSRQSWRALHDAASDYARPLYRHVDVRIDLEAESFSSILGYDLEMMANDPEFRGMLNQLGAARGNSYYLCERQLALAEAVQSLVSDSAG